MISCFATGCGINKTSDKKEERVSKIASEEADTVHMDTRLKIIFQV